MEERLLTKEQVVEMVGYSRQRIDSLEGEGRFPSRIKPSGRKGRALWSFLEIQQYISDLKAKRDSKKQ